MLIALRPPASFTLVYPCCRPPLPSTAPRGTFFRAPAGRVPEHIVRNMLVIVAQHVADAGNLRPWNFRMPGFQLVAEMPAGLGNDLDAALDQPPLALVRLEGLERHAGHLAADELDRLYDMVEGAQILEPEIVARWHGLACWFLPARVWRRYTCHTRRHRYDRGPTAMIPVLTEIGRGLGWRPWQVIAMLWGYFDESGEYENGHLRRLTLGGVLAPFETWERFVMDWGQILKDFGIQMFHMTDFEVWQPPFDFICQNGQRDYERHNRLLNRVIGSIIEYATEIAGFVAVPEQPILDFKEGYSANAAKAFREFGINIYHGSEPVTLVFAKHPEFSLSRIGRYFDEWARDNKGMEFGGIGNPKNICPLQAADVIAYEISRWNRAVGPDQERYPLRQLRDGLRRKGASFRFTFAP